MGHTCLLVSRVLLVHRSGIHLAALVFTLTVGMVTVGEFFASQRVKPCLLEKGVLLEAGVSCWEVTTNLTFDQ